jgi:hypothetical protein
MSNLNFSQEQAEFLKNASDILLRNTGITYLKDISVLCSKLETENSIYDAKDMKLISLLCDVSLKASGVASLKHVIAILNLFAKEQ